MPSPFKVPDGHTEQEILAAIEKSVRILAPSFVFGYYSVDDIEQQARLFGLQAVEGWDTSRPFANFAYTHIRNRLINFRRDKLRRNDPPCRKCHAGQYCTSEGACRHYREWAARNNTKANLMRPLDLQRVADERESRTRCESEAEQGVELAELLGRIDAELPVELRSAYLRMREGLSVPRGPRAQVMELVQRVMQCRGARQDD